jgi:hypothetical protein
LTRVAPGAHAYRALSLKGGDAEPTNELVRKAMEEERAMLAEERRRASVNTSAMEELMQEANRQEISLLEEERLEDAGAKRMREDGFSGPLEAKRARTQQQDVLIQQALKEERELEERERDGLENRSRQDSGATSQSRNACRPSGARSSERTRRLLVQAVNEEMLMLELEGANVSAVVKQNTVNAGQCLGSKPSTTLIMTTDAGYRPSK